MKLVVIGHGYLGRAVEQVFSSAGWWVVPVSRSGGDGVIGCDASDESAVFELPDADAIVHCAASGRGGGPEQYRKVYLDGCRNLAARYPGKPLLFTSSTSVYGQTDGSVVDELGETLPPRETGRILREAEDAVLEAGGAVARLAGIYGPARSVVLRKFLAGETVIEEDGRRFINQIHRDDAANAVFGLVTGNHRGIFNVCDSRPTSQRELVHALCEMFGKPMPPSGPRDMDRKRGWTHKWVSNAKLLATGWQPQYPSFLDAVPELAGTLREEDSIR